MRGRTAFGAGLRRERERRGITLEAISEETKVGVALLEGLERGDVSRWPAGIFRRAFVRAYAETIGLETRRVLNDFLQAFPEEDETQAASPSLALVEHDGAEPLRLTLAGDARATMGSYGTRLSVAGADLVGAAVVAGAVGLIAGSWSSPAAAAAAICWYSVGLVATGRTPGAWIVHQLTALVSSRTPKAAAAPKPVSADERAVLFDLQTATRRRQPAQAPDVEREGRAAER